MKIRITGKLVRLGDAEARIEVGPFEHEVFIPEFVRRHLQPLVGETVSLRTIEFLDGNPQQGRLIPRLIGFLSEAEAEFFDMICSVDGMGVKKTLRAMVRPVREVAEAIEEQDIKQLSLLPGIGPAMGERIVAKLRRKMAKFALIAAKDSPQVVDVERTIYSEAFEALVAIGFNAGEAQEKLEAVLKAQPKLKTAEDVIFAIYQLDRK